MTGKSTDAITTIEDALKYIVTQYGEKMLYDSGRTCSMVADLVPNLNRERNLLSVFYRCGGAEALLNCVGAPRSARDAALAKLQLRMKEEWGIAPESAALLCASFWNAANPQNRIRPAVSQQRPVTPPPKPAPAASKQEPAESSLKESAPPSGGKGVAPTSYSAQQTTPYAPTPTKPAPQPPAGNGAKSGGAKVVRTLLLLGALAIGISFVTQILPDESRQEPKKTERVYTPDEELFLASTTVTIGYDSPHTVYYKYSPDGVLMYSGSEDGSSGLTYSYYDDGTLKKKEKSDHSYLAEYYPDGTLRSETEDDGSTIKTESYDESGNIESSVVKRASTGETLITTRTYENRYDDSGRLTEKAMYLQNGVLMCKYNYSYIPEGGYYEEYTEYNGSEGTNPVWGHSISRYNEQGNMIEQNLDIMEEKNCQRITTFLYDEEGNELASCEYLYKDNTRQYERLKESSYDEHGKLLSTYEHYIYGSEGTYNKTEYGNEYDTDGNLIKVTEYHMNGNLTSAREQVEEHREQRGVTEYKYDDQGRKLEVVGYKGDGSISYTNSFEYDDRGNMIKSENANATEVYRYAPIDEVLYTG